jgi:hypothetical protein
MRPNNYGSMIEEIVKTFTKEKLTTLKRAYHKAKKEGQESFTFDGQLLLTEYAKYLIEYGRHVT